MPRKHPAAPAATLFVVACTMLGAEPAFRKGDLVALVPGAQEGSQALTLHHGAHDRTDEPDPHIELADQAQLDRLLRLGSLKPATDADFDGLADDPDPHLYTGDLAPLE